MTVTDDVEVELLDDDAPGSSRIVELRPRSRWRELALALAAVVAVVGVGLVGDDGDDEATAAPATTSSTRRVERPTTTRRPVASVRRPRTTTSTTRPGEIRHAAGAGAALPELPMTLAVLGSDSVVMMTDLVTGDRCWVRPSATSHGDAWMPWSTPVIAGGLLVQANDRTVIVDDACTISEVAIDFRNGYPVAASAERLWMGSGDGSRLVEHALPSGEKTGRTYELPRNAAVNSVVAGEDLIIGVNGSMTLVDPATDSRRDLGTGTPLAAHGALLAFSTCPELRCRVGLLDLVTGEQRTVDGVQPTFWEPSHFSADGRLLVVAIAGSGRDQSATAVIEIESGTVEVFDVGLARPLLSPDGRWLLGQVGSGVVAYDLAADGERLPRHLLRDVMNVQGFGLL